MHRLAAAGAERRPRSVRADLGLDLEGMAEAARAKAPSSWSSATRTTRRGCSSGGMRALLDALHGCITVVDEAYVEYVDPDGGSTASRTLSGLPRHRAAHLLEDLRLAGLRLGYAIVAHELALPRCRPEPFNVNRVALAAGGACLAH